MRLIGIQMPLHLSSATLNYFLKGTSAVAHTNKDHLRFNPSTRVERPIWPPSIRDRKNG